MTSDGALAFTHWKLEVFDQGMAQPPGIDDTLGGSPGRKSATPASAAPASTDSQADSETPPAFKLPTADELEKLQADAHREGYAAGYEEGTARVRMEAMRLHSVIEQLEEALASLDTEVAQGVLHLGVEIARQVVRQAIAVKPEVIVGVVREAINQLPHQHTAVYLNPDDASLVRSHAGDQLAHAGHRIFEDTTIARGGCKIEAGGSHIDATLATRWTRIVEALIDDADWIEHD
ncbi:flagellar assembly protein FliH [Methyloversatilis sp.]|jgi:flagellar assembly protein FliH|uniref:flagellar assembly protein FliH n=1 Tax=Methyloversatilis sp. TaxID=2569862 RepID=UPI0027B96C0B|nr:flagellar assembly protein FliH [Methyloversatilis sp.]